MAHDILDQIDAAVGCQQCGGPLDTSPSEDFCAETCQNSWHAQRAGASWNPWVELWLDTSLALAAIRDLGTALQGFNEALSLRDEDLPGTGDAVVADRALQARRNVNTGPPHRRRPPRFH